MNYNPPASASDVQATLDTIQGDIDSLQSSLESKADIGTGTTSAPQFTSIISNAGMRVTSSVINDQVGTSYSLQSSDNGKIVTLTNGSAISLTVPSGLGAGFSCQVIQGGAGTVTFTPSSTTISSYGSLLSLAGQYASASLFATAADAFILAGNLA